MIDCFMVMFRWGSSCHIDASKTQSFLVEDCNKMIIIAVFTKNTWIYIFF